MTSFICQPCKDKTHHDCRGGTWCDCQHYADGRPPKRPVA